MDKLVIEGGYRLAGEVRVSGAKNAALPILCASLLSAEPLTLVNVPRLNDVRTMRTLLSQMGVRQEGDEPQGYRGQPRTQVRDRRMPRSVHARLR